MYVMWTKPSI